jgi:hypothetical protein
MPRSASIVRFRFLAHLLCLVVLVASIVLLIGYPTTPAQHPILILRLIIVAAALGLLIVVTWNVHDSPGHGPTSRQAPGGEGGLGGEGEAGDPGGTGGVGGAGGSGVPGGRGGHGGRGGPGRTGPPGAGGGPGGRGGDGHPPRSSQ